MKIFLFVFLLMPSFVLGYEVFILQNLVDPIAYIYTVTGAVALLLLFFTTTISLIRPVTNLVKYRKLVGLFAFYYAFLHLLNFVIFDMELDISFAISETLDKPFIYLGMIAFLLILFMAITSFGVLFKKYFKYHKVIYIALALIVIHFIMAQKSLSIEQWIYLSIMLLIMAFKVDQLSKKRLLNM